MIFPQKARYNKVMQHVTTFFTKEKVTEFPLDPFEVIEKNGWGLITYTELAAIHNTDIAGVINAFQSQDGYTIYDGFNYTIAYNDTVTPPERIRFTLMHEIGHIYLNHLTDFNETILRRTTLTNTKYKVLEDEANAFARNTLTPVVLVTQLRMLSVDDIIAQFQITAAAAKTRLSFINSDLGNMAMSTFKAQLNHFKSFIRSVKHGKLCLTCNHSFVQEHATYCDICGESNLVKSRGGEDMRYKKIELDEFHWALECPICENEELHGAYCNVCGMYIVNRCTGLRPEVEWQIEDFTQYKGCDTLLKGNSRFCHKCGSQSTFYNQGALEHWRNEKSPQRTNLHVVGALDLSDDDLPF